VAKITLVQFQPWHHFFSVANDQSHRIGAGRRLHAEPFSVGP
jgi:hypothetical protein